MKHRWLFIVLFFALLVQGYLIYYYHYVWWDSGVYIGMSKYLYSLGQVGFWENMRPPFFPLLIGIFWKIGLPSLLSARIFVMITSLLSIYLTYRIGRQLFSWRTGVVAAAVLATSFTFLFNGSHVFSDVPSDLFALIAILFLLFEWDFLTGIFLGLAFLTRFPQGFMLATAGIYLLVLCWQHREPFSRLIKRSFWVGLGFGIPALIHLITNLFYYHDLLRPFLKAMNIVKNATPNYIDVKYFYLVHLVMENYLLPFGLFAAYALLRKKRYAVFTLLFLPCAFYFAYFAMKPSREARYMLVFLPYLALLTAEGLEELFSKWRWIIAQFLLVSMVLSLLFLHGSLSLYLTDFGHYEPVEYDRVVSNYYPQVNGTNYALVSNPSVAAFTDHKILVMYRTPFDEAYGKYFRRTDVKYAYLNECDLQCPDGNEKCLKDRTEFLYFMTHNKLLFNQTYGNCRYYVIEKA